MQGAAGLEWRWQKRGGKHGFKFSMKLQLGHQKQKWAGEETGKKKQEDCGKEIHQKLIQLCGGLFQGMCHYI